MLRPFLLTFALLPAAAWAQADAQADAATQAARFADGDLAPLWAEMTPEMRAALGSEAALAAFRDRLVAQTGAPAGAAAEALSASPLGDILFRDQVWGEGGPLLRTTIATDAAGRLAGLFLGEATAPAPSPHAGRPTQAALRLPFDAPRAGAWIVYWGGPDLVGNYHAATVPQRFAMDLVVHRDGATFAGDPLALDSYFCWGEPILAPAAGTVIAAIDGLPDQPIGASDPGHPAGNHVVIDLGIGEYLFLAHLRQGSVAVADGDAVRPGDRIGLCGNSGNSSEPHLHVHLQTTPDLESGEGLPLEFRDYLSDGDPVARGAPGRGEELTPG